MSQPAARSSPLLSPLFLSLVSIVVAVVVQSQLFPSTPSSPASSPSLTLSYFDVAGRAEITRVAFRLGGVTFEDERLTRAQFADRKPSLPFGQVPVLAVDGEVVAESQAVFRYAARVAGLFPANNLLGTLLIDEILTTIDEVSETLLTPTMREPDADKKKQMREALLEGPLPTALAQIEARLRKMSEYPLFHENSHKVYAHEIAVWRFVDKFESGQIDHIPTTVTHTYDIMTATHKKVAAAQSEPAHASSSPVELVHVQQPKNLKLMYFDGPGRAEKIRLALFIGGIEFQDERLTYSAFLERKPTLPLGQVPVLEVDGIVVAQSVALLRYAGSLSGLYPVNDPLEAAKIDEILARIEDIDYALHDSNRERDQDKKRAMREHLAAERIPKALAVLDKRVAYWKQVSSYTFGEELTIADLAISGLVQSFQGGNVDYVPATVIDSSRALLAVHDAVSTHPRVQDWQAGRE